MTLFLYFISVASLAMAAPLIRWSGTSPEVLGLWRLLGASLFLLPFITRQKDILNWLRRPNWDHLWVFVSAFFFFTHQWTYSFAAQNTTIAHCMILFATNPLFASAGAVYFFKEKLSWRWIVAYFLSFLGIFLLVKDSIAPHSSSNSGNVFALFSAALYGGYVLAGKKARQSVNNFTYSFFVYLIAGLGFLAASMWRQNSLWPIHAHSWWAIAGTIFIPTFLGHALFTYLMKRMDLNLMTCGKLMEPLFSSLPAFLIFQELPDAGTYQAFALTAVGILILFLPKTKLISAK